jgi:hypothetical protein
MVALATALASLIASNGDLLGTFFLITIVSDDLVECLASLAHASFKAAASKARVEA